MDWSTFAHAVFHAEQGMDLLIRHDGVLVYVLLFAVVCSEIGVVPLFFLPGDPLLFVCGAFCATHALDIWLLMPLLFVAALAGSMLGYGIGRVLGRQTMAHGYRWLSPRALEKTAAFHARHGGATFLLSPFVAVVRTFAPFLAGVSAMDFGRFSRFASAGAALWVGSLLWAGYFFGRVPIVREHLQALVLCGVMLGVGALIIGAGWRGLQARWHRADNG
ncbi:Inner membrane protein YqjA [Andreprevotia sp. IGB-42]|uniref:VTT domain-containing protein n=1 Tax=Andreprevotia sp. IGB-42 TaxID=2497473 RepID=UPI0013594E17|nr:VTT domain-containing protein [Andreprevotia sp. IGB-42]KAF0812169.1 Inner membrane protein YqjA [Andreprevotia sp. IGB-42]